MSLSEKKIECIKQAVEEYLCSLKLIPTYKMSKGDVRIKYKQHCFMKSFSSSDNDWPCDLVGPIETWRKTLAVINKETDGRANHGFVSTEIGKIYCKIQQFPPEDKQMQEYAQQITEHIAIAYEHTVVAYVPLVNIRLDHTVKMMELAEVELYSGKGNNEFDKHKDNLPGTMEFDVPDGLPYLKITVEGDDDSIKKEVAAKTEDALRALRFVSWTNVRSDVSVPYNESKDVDIYPFYTPQGYFLYVNDNNKVFNRYQTDVASLSRLTINDKKLKDFKEFGLDNINCHFAYRSNPISFHILLALEWYDNGVQAQKEYIALFCFVACVNGILSWKDTKAEDSHEELKKRYRKLLDETAQDAEGLIDFYSSSGFSVPKCDFDNSTPLEDVISVVAEDYAERYRKLYAKQRGPIAHGFSENRGIPLTPDDVRDARLLAQNTIRLVMKVVAKHSTWQDYKDVEEWFNATT